MGIRYWLAGMPRYRSAPLDTDRMPPGIPFIIGNEAAERFSFYGMRGILVPFMTAQLLARDGTLATMGESEATGWFHLFVWAVYLTPLMGAILADYAWGKYRTIIRLSIVYCLGHLALALDATRLGLFIGLVLISLGSGGSLHAPVTSLVSPWRPECNSCPDKTD
jgi:proton-dependent oligopeptide transporter, POT family